MHALRKTATELDFPRCRATSLLGRKPFCALVACVVLAIGTSTHAQSSVSVAAISFEPKKFDLKGNADRLAHWFRQAAAGGAQLAVAPEGALDGYVVNEILAGKADARRMREVAVPLDSPVIKRFCELAKSLDMCLTFGFAELREQDVFNTAVFIDHTGRICGTYQKMQFHEGYDESWWFNRLGSRSRTFDTPFGRCGILICNDRWNAALAEIPALDGAQFLIIPAYGSTSPQQDAAVLDRARETQLPIVEANVGVSLVVSDGEITSRKRQTEGVTFGVIDIPENRPRDPSKRDRAEQAFLQWRQLEMIRRRDAYLEQVDPRGRARDSDVAQLKTSQLDVTIGNNRSWKDARADHAAGYNGIFRLTSTHLEDESPFVPAYAGMNLEHYFDAAPRADRNVFFEPRFAAMDLRRLSEQAVELHQPPTPFFSVESRTRFAVREPYYVDFTFQCTPHRAEYEGNFLGVFWASYINGPLNKSVYFLDGESSLDSPVWRQWCTQQHNRDSTVRSQGDTLQLAFAQQDTLFSNLSPLRYSVPFFYGRFRHMVLIYVFRPQPHLRFAHSPSGGGQTTGADDTNPAWDFHLIIPDPKRGDRYEVQGCLIYKPWRGRNDVLEEVRSYLEVVSPQDR